MPENNKSTYEPMTFDKIKISLASPEKIREWAHRTPEPEDKTSEAWERWNQEGMVLKRKRSITEHLSRKEMVCSVRRYLDRARTGNVTAVSIRRSDIKALSVTDAALK